MFYTVYCVTFCDATHRQIDSVQLESVVLFLPLLSSSAVHICPHVQGWTLGWSRGVLWSSCPTMSTWTTGTCTHTVCTARCECWMRWFIRMHFIRKSCVFKAAVWGCVCWTGTSHGERALKPSMCLACVRKWHTLSREPNLMQWCEVVLLVLTPACMNTILAEWFLMN